MNIDSIKNGIVIDHIQAKKGMEIYETLKLEELDCQVAIITNAKSKKMGRKDIIKIDKNIDFRRVRNLLVYFRHTAIELTTDVYDIEEWQGGDIVVFEGHIGIVSDKRNHNGVSFVIHNGSPIQAGYEQDILESRNDIVAHFRIS